MNFNIKNIIKSIIEYFEHPYEKNTKLNIKDLSYEKLTKKSKEELIKLKSLLIFKIKVNESRIHVSIIGKFISLYISCLTIIYTIIQSIIQSIISLYEDTPDEHKGTFFREFINLLGMEFIANSMLVLGIAMISFHLYSLLIQKRNAIYHSKIFEIDEVILECTQQKAVTKIN